MRVDTPLCSTYWKDNSVRNDNYVNGYGTVADTLRFLKRLSVIESQQTDVDDN